MEAMMVLLLVGCAAAGLLWRWKARRLGRFVDRLCPNCRRAIRTSAAVCPHCSLPVAESRGPTSTTPTSRDERPPAPPSAAGKYSGSGGAAFIAGALAGAMWPRPEGNPEVPESGGLQGFDHDVADTDMPVEDADLLGMRHLAELDDLHDPRDHQPFIPEEEEDEDLVDERAEEGFDHDFVVEEMEDLDLW